MAAKKETQSHINTEITMVESGSASLATPAQGVVTMAEGTVLHDFDLRPAVVKLAQSTSASGTPGTLVRTDTEEEYEELHAVPLRVQATRTKWPETGFSRERLPECSSDDGIRSVIKLPGGTEPRFPNQICAKCEFQTDSPWSVPEGQEYCQPGYKILLMDIESFEVYGMRLNGTSASVARPLGARPNLRKAVMRLWGEKTTTERGSWFKLKAKAVRQLTEDEITEARLQFQAFGIEFDDNF